MAGPAEPYRLLTTWRPPGTGCLDRALGRLDFLFDRVLTPPLNPLHRTGTLAALLLAVALVTGVYLLLVYEVGRPYESVLALQADPLVGRWMRAVHRYASDLAVVAVALHVLRLLVRGQTWGPRALAWVTGVVLAGLMALSALTGFVLVWDTFGQKVAEAGARMLDLVPLFPEPPSRAFAGDRPLSSQFFFMNLFLHVAVPLGLMAGLAVHTARLARAAWFPERRVIGGTLGALLVLSVAWPAPLPPPADLLAVPGRVATDWFYGFWLPLAGAFPAAVLAGGTVLTAVVLTVPWWLRPRRPARPAPAHVDPERCEGCEQCFQDCPYQAIEMVTGLHPEAHPLRASVRADRCVSCGLCAGSCASLAIGPPLRTAAHQLASARQLVAGPAGGRRLVVACRHNAGGPAALRARAGAGTTLEVMEVDCAGTLHPGTLSYLAGHLGGAVVLACPPASCRYREGARLADARLCGERPPAIPGRLPALGVRVLHHPAAEWRSIEAALAGSPGPGRPGSGRLPRSLAAGALALALLGLTGLGSRWPQGTGPGDGRLRLGWRLAGQVLERCRDLAPAELARRPAHMRSPRECTRLALDYHLVVAIDGRVRAERTVRAPGLRADRPLTVDEDLDVPPGDHDVRVSFAPELGPGTGVALAFQERVRFEPPRIVLITLEDDRLVRR
jgi:ferredoxin